MAYPVLVEMQPPARFERVQLLLRGLICVAAGTLQHSSPGLFGTLYFVLPVAAAVLISRRTEARFPAHDSGWLVECLSWVVAFYAYMLLVTDRFPLSRSERVVQLRVTVSGEPSAGQALARLLLSIPHALMLALLSIVSAVFWLVAALSILFTERCPTGLCTFQRHYLSWIARVLVYHASLVQPYPPFSLADDNSLSHGSDGLAPLS